MYSHVRCNPPAHPRNTPQMTITNFNYEGSYLPGLICNIVVKAALGRSAGRSTSPNASWDIYYGMYLAAILDSLRKSGNFLYFWIIRLVNSQLALYIHVRCNPPQHPQMTITNFNYEGSYLLGLICNIVVKADLGRSTPSPRDLPVDLNGNFRCLPLELI